MIDLIRILGGRDEPTQREVGSSTSRCSAVTVGRQAVARKMGTLSILMWVALAAGAGQTHAEVLKARRLQVTPGTCADSLVLSCELRSAARASEGAAAVARFRLRMSVEGTRQAWDSGWQPLRVPEPGEALTVSADVVGLHLPATARVTALILLDEAGQVRVAGQRRHLPVYGTVLGAGHAFVWTQAPDGPDDDAPDEPTGQLVTDDSAGVQSQVAPAGSRVSWGRIRVRYSGRDAGRSSALEASSAR